MTEDVFLEKLFKRLPAPSNDLVIPPGDDCAALRVGGDKLLLIAVDQVVGDRHYHLEGSVAASPEQVGRKLLARNLSDIAAMGGLATQCLVAVGVGKEFGEEWLDGFFAGILALAEAYGVEMIGGDLAATPHDNVASLTIIGEVPEKQVCRRRGASPGDLLFATGAFGSSLPSGQHLSFEPRCREGQWLAKGKFAKAMIDVSDGLLLDANRLCRASGVGLRLDVDAVPRRTPQTTIEQALADGEDYELLLAVSPAKAGALVREWPFANTPLTGIGHFVERGGIQLVDAGGQCVDAPVTQQGFDHFRC